MEANRLRQVLELYYTVCNQVEPTSHLPVLLRAVCVRNTAVSYQTFMVSLL